MCFIFVILNVVHHHSAIHSLANIIIITDLCEYVCHVSTITYVCTRKHGIKYRFKVLVPTVLNSGSRAYRPTLFDVCIVLS